MAKKSIMEKLESFQRTYICFYLVLFLLRFRSCLSFIQNRAEHSDRNETFWRPEGEFFRLWNILPSSEHTQKKAKMLIDSISCYCCCYLDPISPLCYQNELQWHTSSGQNEHQLPFIAIYFTSFRSSRSSASLPVRCNVTPGGTQRCTIGRA